MSSSPDAARRSQVLRGATVRALPALPDLDALAPGARSVIDPDVLEQARAQGRTEGFEAGHAEGLAAGLAAAAEQAGEQRAHDAAAVSSALAALDRALAATSAAGAEAVAELEAALVAGAVELAEALVGRELALSSDPGRDALVRALAMAEGDDPAVVHLHPDDLAVLGDHADLAPGRELRFVADPGVERGGCLVQLGDGSVDARLSSALQRVREVLSR